MGVQKRSDIREMRMGNGIPMGYGWWRFICISRMWMAIAFVCWIHEWRTGRCCGDL